MIERFRMKVEYPPIDGLALVEVQTRRDERGFFVERFKRSAFEQVGLPADFVQENHSRSEPRVLRGLHYQFSPPQSKLVGVTRGRIWDVVVDIRTDSSTFGDHYAVELSDSNGLMLWIPAGFAHGFCVLGEEAADVLYKTDAEYNGDSEGGIIWSDAELAIDWPVKEPVLSAKDEKLQAFAEYRANPVF